MKRRLTTKDSDGDNDDERDSGIADYNIAEMMIAMIYKFSFHLILEMIRTSFIVLTIAMAAATWVYALNKGWFLGNNSIDVYA